MEPKKTYPYEPDYAVPPGATLAETIEALGMTQRELALRTGLTSVSVARIISGDQPITYETANKLEMATRVPARFWNALEAQYRERLAKLQEREQMRKDLDWLRQIPVKELQARGLVAHHAEKIDVLRDVLAFYGVSSVSAWCKLWESPGVAARRSTCFESASGPISAWIRQGEIQAQALECQPFSKARFEKALIEIRRLTHRNQGEFEPELKRSCAEAGVAVALVAGMKKVPWNGAAKWLAPDKAMILLSFRGKGEDRFWFTFFHEAGHILLHSKKELYIDDGAAEGQREQEANQFASEKLIPGYFNERIRGSRSKVEISALAEELEVSPGIVAGRYQHLSQNWRYFQELIRKFDA